MEMKDRRNTMVVVVRFWLNSDEWEEVKKVGYKPVLSGSLDNHNYEIVEAHEQLDN